MIFCNLNSKFNIPKELSKYVSNVIKNSEVNRFHISIFENCIFSNLEEIIPVFLLNEDSMPDSEIKDIAENPPTDCLGFYQRYSKVLNKDYPVIAICPERILSYSKSKEEYFYLTTKVLLHEFSHAALDSDHSYFGADSGYKYEVKDEFYYWMEESMANYLTLCYLESYNLYINNGFNNQPDLIKDYILEYSKKFISMQPPQYALGLKLFMLHLERYRIYHWEWSAYKTKIQNKEFLKKKWLDYVKSKYMTIDGRKLAELYNQLWKT